MRICFLVMLLLFWGVVPVAAVSPVNADSIAAAQEYGKVKANSPLNEFFQPWTIYEEKAEKLGETGERAYAYTPFLLLAADARDKALNSKTISLADAEKVLTEYNGYVIFGAVLYGGEPDFADKLMVVVKQGKKTVKTAADFRPQAEKTAWSKEQKVVYSAHCYFYFNSKDITIDKPLVLQISGGDKQERRFYFELNRFR